MIRDHKFDMVDQNHYLKVFFLLFFNKLDILSIEVQVPGQAPPGEIAAEKHEL